MRQTSLSAPFCVNMLQTYHNQAFPVAFRIPIKCCFPLAEARKKRKTFFSHTSGSLSASVRGVEVTWLMRFPSFLVAVRHCLTSRPPTLLVFWRFFLEDSFFHFLFVVGRFVCIQSLSYCSFQIIFRASLFVLL